MYELSKVYWNGGERRSLILGACGSVRPASVHEPGAEFDFFTIRGDIEEILRGFDTPMRLTTDNIPRYYHPGRFARVGHLAIFGELHPAYAEPFKFRQRVYLAEIDVDLLLGSSVSRQLEPSPKYPAIRRDFSLLFDKGTPYAAVQRTIEDAGIAEVVRVEPFDRMESGPFPETKYSLALSVVYQSAERTLTDAEVETFDRKIVQSLADRLGAHLRT
jgi:phenylalanyl-tRNA synthetase beta chain